MAALGLKLSWYDCCFPFHATFCKSHDYCSVIALVTPQ
jgi:hypothetical protein